MNKDVIYIEPEDDITDIIAKVEKAKERIVALVPPKKAGVFRSLVNIKLIAKAGAGAEKSVVLVTADPSIMKLAAAVKMPVAKNLQTAPVVPEAEKFEAEEHTIEAVGDEAETEEGAEERDEADDEDAHEAHASASKVADKKGEKTGVEKAEKSADEDEDEEVGEDDVEDENDDDAEVKGAGKKLAQKPAKERKNGGKIGGWFRQHKKMVIAGGICLVGIVGFLVWALGFAPAVDITVAIRTESAKFSEGITLVSSATEEDVKAGKFYLEQKKIESSEEVEFTATGEKNLGEKATGEIVIYAYFKGQGSVAVNTGTTFAHSGLNYTANDGVTLSWDGNDDDACDNKGQASSLVKSGCLISARIKVTAAGSGTKYNIGAEISGWSTNAAVAGAYSDKAMTGGTDSVVTVVQQSDVEKAKESLTTANKDESKEKLYATIDTNEYYILENSFEQNASAVTSTPAVDEQVKDGEKAALKATTTTSVYVIERNKLKEFIAAKTELEDGKKIYEIKDAYIENYALGATSAKLKGQYFVGPKLTETEVVEKIMGRGLGDAQREIRDLYGVASVTIDPSYPWVTAVPTDSNKVTIKFEIKDQDGNEIKDATTDSGSEDTDKSTDSDKKSETKES